MPKTTQTPKTPKTLKTPKTTSRLGKGLSALVTPRATKLATSPKPDSSTATQSAIREIPIESITPKLQQPRMSFQPDKLNELADSITANGVIQPIVVRSAGKDSFEIVAGERRWRAAQIAKLPTIPAIVRELSDEQSFEIALIENLQREDLDPIERATAYRHYMETFGGSIESLAKRLSESRANVSNYLRLLNLHPEILAMLSGGELGMSQARAIAGIIDPHRQLAVARMAVRRNLAVRQVEELARAAAQDEPDADGDESPEAQSRKQHLSEVEESFSQALGLRVRLYAGRRKNSGRIVISYSNLDEFDRLADQLGVASVE